MNQSCKFYFSKNKFTFLLLLLNAGFSMAQNKDSILQTFQTLTLLEVRAIRVSDAAPFVKTEMNKSIISNENCGKDLPYILQNTVSSVVTSDAGTGIGYSSLRIRGTDNTRINFTLNGIPVNDAESQSTYFVDLPDLASSTSSIQIQRGVGSSTNGGSAFGATISLHNTELQQNAGGFLSATMGSFNTRKITLQSSTGLIDKKWQMDIRLSKIVSDGYVERSASNLWAIQTLLGFQLNKWNSFKFLFLQGHEKTGQAWDGVPQDSLTTHRKFNELGLMSDGNYYKNQTDNYKQDYFQLFWDHQINHRMVFHNGIFLTLGKGFYEEYKLNQSFVDYNLNDFITPKNDTLKSTNLIRQLWLNNQFYGAVSSINYRTFHSDITAGINISQYNGKHYGQVIWADYGVPNNYEWYNLNAHKNDVNGFLKMQYRSANNLFLFGDIQLRNVHYNINGFRENPTYKVAQNYIMFNPKIGVSYFWKKHKNFSQKVYLSLSKGSKEPNRDDYLTALNQLPKVEHLNDIECGYEYYATKFSFKFNTYYMDYKNQLILTGQLNDVGAYTRINVPKSNRTGLEIEANYRPFKWLTILANGALSKNKITQFTEYLDNWDSGGQIAIIHNHANISFSPKLVTHGSVIVKPFSSQNFEIEWKNTFVSKQYLDNTTNENRKINAYFVNDLNLRYAFTVKHFKEINLKLSLLNLFNNLYESNGWNYSYLENNQIKAMNYYYPQAGFHVLAVASFTF